MRIVFMGSPEEVIAPLKTLENLCEKTEHQITAVVSQPPKKVGRRGVLTDPPLASYAKSQGLLVLQPASAKHPDFLEELETLKPDLIVTAAYGQILSDEFLAIPKRATINIHPSLLPAYRGATPVPAALLDGVKTSGVTILFTVKKLDAGAIIAQQKSELGIKETTGDLTKRLFEMGGNMLPEAINSLANPGFLGTKQEEDSVTFCHKISKQDGLVHWQKDANEIVNHYRAYTPWPSVYTFYQGKRLTLCEMSLASDNIDLPKHSTHPGSFFYIKKEKALYVYCGNQKAVLIHKIKPEGGKVLDIASFINGIKGVKLGVFDAS